MIKWPKSNPGDLDSLIKGCLEKDRQAQNQLYKLFSGKMLSLCFRYSQSREEAEDTLVEGFMKVYENLHQFKNKGSLEGWIRRIMVNTAIEKYRRANKLYRTVQLTEVREMDFTADTILNEINVKELILLIQKLPSGYQIVFNLYVFEGLKHKEIAEKLGISEGTSKSNLFDARAILQRGIANSLIEAKASNE
jgi:RNA polymerase sigma-70 factor (ECF subfamily)